MIVRVRILEAGDPGGQQVLPAPKSNGHGYIIEAVAQVIEEDDDNGDGEAA